MVFAPSHIEHHIKQFVLPAIEDCRKEGQLPTIVIALRPDYIDPDGAFPCIYFPKHQPMSAVIEVLHHTLQELMRGNVR